MKHYIEDEPCSVGADTVVKLLERIGWSMSAALIRDIAQDRTERNLEAKRWRDAYADVLGRLHKYEPPAPRDEQPDFRPPPEASD